MKSRQSAADKDFLNKFNEEFKFSPATPTHHNLSQEDLLKLFSKENENINGYSCKNSNWTPNKLIRFGIAVFFSQYGALKSIVYLN